MLVNCPNKSSSVCSGRCSECIYVPENLKTRYGIQQMTADNHYQELYEHDMQVRRRAYYEVLSKIKTDLCAHYLNTNTPTINVKDEIAMIDKYMAMFGVEVMQNVEMY